MKACGVCVCGWCCDEKRLDGVRWRDARAGQICPSTAERGRRGEEVVQPSESMAEMDTAEREPAVAEEAWMSERRREEEEADECPSAVDGGREGRAA